MSDLFEANDEITLEASARIYHRPQCFWSALVNNVGTDLKLSVTLENPGKILEVHSVFMMAASPYFEDLLKNMKTELRVEIPDIQYSTMLRILKYIYTGEFKFSGAESLVQGIYASDRFKMSDLHEKCRLELLNHMKNCPEDCILVLENRELLAELETEFVNKAKDLMQPNLPQILRSPEISNVSFDIMEMLMYIYNSEATEVDYFEMLKNWTEASCKRKDVEPSDLAKRDMCAGLYHNIRFHEINQQYFSKNICNSGFLTQMEMVDMFYYYSFPNDNSRTLPCKIISRYEEKISKYLNDSPQANEVVRGVISMVWIRKWLNYVENTDVNNFPGTINNSDIIQEGRTNLAANVDYVHINWEDYLFLKKKYGIDVVVVDEITVNNNVAQMKNEPQIFKKKFTTQIGVERSVGEPTKFEISVDGFYRITVGGAKGGNSFDNNIAGGFGATKEATFNFKKGNTLSMVIGKSGGNAAQQICGAGGGGGTFISLNENLILAAGGGGGACFVNNASQIQSGRPGVVDINGSASGGPLYQAQGGKDGQAGTTSTAGGHPCGGAGAGWKGESSIPAMQNNNKHSQFGYSKGNGWRGGKGTSTLCGAGGYGGGGEGGLGTSAGYYGGGGGGGGYSGGGASSSGNGGGGGGSFASGEAPSGVDGGNNHENGFVSIEYVHK